MASTTVDASELFNLLESNDIHVVEEIKTLIHENLSTAREPWLLNGLVDYYMASNSQRAIEILTTVREPLDKHLFEKLNECLKSSRKTVALTLLGCTVRKQPSWLHKIVHTPLFNSLLQCIKSDTDVLVVMSSVLIITTLLPIIPSFVGPYLQDIFDGFSRLASWKLNPPGIVPDIFILHLQVAVYSLFHRLYGMYPCNFLSYLRERYGKDTNKEFNKVILPMLEHVRMHPNLVTGSKDMETDKARWKKMETHDIVMECAKVSLDTLESTRDDIPYHVQVMKSASKSGTISQDGSAEQRHFEKDVRLKNQLDYSTPSTPQHPVKLSLSSEVTTVWSPSVLCGLTTPPSQISPSSSLADISGSLYQSVPQTPTHLSSGGTSSSFQFNEEATESSGDPTQRMPRGRANILSRLTQSWVVKSATPSPPLENEDKCASLPATPNRENVATNSVRVQSRESHSDETNSSANRVKVENMAEKLSERLQEEADKEAETKRSDEIQKNVSVKDLSKVIEGLSQSMEQDEKELEDVNEEISSIVNTPRKPDAKNDAAERSRSVTPFKSTTEFLTGPSSYPETTLHHEHSVDYRYDERINFCSDLEPHIDDLDFRLRASSYPVSSKVMRKLQDVDDFKAGGTSFEKPDSKREELEKASRTSTIDACVGTDDNGKDIITQIVTCQTTTVTSTTHSFTPIQEDSDTTQTEIHNRNVETDSFPYMKLFPMVLPPSMLSECILQLEQSPQCSSLFQSPGGSFSSMGGNVLSALSPPQLLDRHIELGSEVHAEELSRLPLTSQPSVNWTHFGGPPPADEINILKGQIQLLHHQLMYERHKRELHAQRNRRLLGKTHKASAMEELARTRLDDVKLLESQLKDAKMEVKSLREENVKLRLTNRDRDKHLQDSLRQVYCFKAENEKLKYQNKEFTEKTKQQMQDVEKLTMDLKLRSEQLFNCTNEVEDLREKVALTDQYKNEVTRLKKEIILMGEFAQKLQDKLSKDKDTIICSKDEIDMIEMTYKGEITCYKEKVQQLNIQLDASKVRINELEATVTQKETAATDQKRFLENVKSLSKGQIQAMEAKYLSLKKTNQRLEAHILKLYNNLEQKKGGITIPEHQSAMRKRNGSDGVRNSKTDRDSPLSSWSTTTTPSSSSSLTSSQESTSDSPTKRNLKVKVPSEAGRGGNVEPVRPLFNINSPGITFSTSSPFKRFHDVDHNKTGKANTLPRTHDTNVTKPSGQLARSYPPQGATLNLNEQPLDESKD
ncbi:hamartin-like [Glandiceps talaboti]